MAKVPQENLTAVNMARDICTDILGKINDENLTDWQKYVVLQNVMKDLYPKMLDYYAEAHK